MTSRRSFFAGFARAAAIIALAPRIAFGVLNKPVAPAQKAFQCFREYYRCPKTGKWKLFHDPDEDFYKTPPENVGLWRTEWDGWHIDCIMAPESVRNERLANANV